MSTDPTTRPALVLVAHSAELARGLAVVAGQMAPGVDILPVGGGPAGPDDVGTDLDRVHAAVTGLVADGRGALLLADLGSAVMVVDAVLEAIGPAADAFRVAHAPFVEGAVLAAVALAGGADVEAAALAARSSVAAWAQAAPAAAPTAAAVAESPAEGGALRRDVEVRNPLGLHARPAAVLARLVAGLDAHVRIDGADAASVIALMRLGVAGGRTVTVEAAGPGAAAALDAVTHAITEGFGEV